MRRDNYQQFSSNLETHSTSEEIVARAFQQVFAEQVVQSFLRVLNKHDLNYESFTTEATRANCHLAAAEVIKVLFDHHSQSFTHMLMLLSHETPSIPFRKVSWAFHCVFAVKDVDGKWFMGTPANYETGALPKYVLGTFEECLTGIASQAGGCWDFDDPSEFRTLNLPKYIHPDTQHTLRIAQIELHRGSQHHLSEDYTRSDHWD